ncbi:cold shock domain-containing protein [Paenibacillus sp. FSL W8-0426]|uniref:cold-shock protein n=1 Tax=Paenibacillus sp. FSL W8-0426 TaxID=2921714 RepID=UPI0030D8B57D
MKIWSGLQGEEMEAVNVLIGPSLGKSRTKTTEPQKPQHKTGVVRYYSADKGYGFIETAGRSIFFHISACDEMDTAYIPVGERVSYEVGADKFGKPCAINVKSN